MSDHFDSGNSGDLRAIHAMMRTLNRIGELTLDDLSFDDPDYIKAQKEFERRFIVEYREDKTAEPSEISRQTVHDLITFWESDFGENSSQIVFDFSSKMTMDEALDTIVRNFDIRYR